MSINLFETKIYVNCPRCNAKNKFLVRVSVYDDDIFISGECEYCNILMGTKFDDYSGKGIIEEPNFKELGFSDKDIKKLKNIVKDFDIYNQLVCATCGKRFKKFEDRALIATKYGFVATCLKEECYKPRMVLREI